MSEESGTGAPDTGGRRLSAEAAAKAGRTVPGESIRFRCPSCGSLFALPISAAEIIARCWKCDTRMRVPPAGAVGAGVGVAETLSPPRGRAAEQPRSLDGARGASEPVEGWRDAPASRPTLEGAGTLQRLGIVLLCSGTVVVAALLLMRVLLPKYSSLARCQNNLRQIGNAALDYAAMYGGVLPDRATLADVPYLDLEAFVCPARPGEPGYDLIPGLFGSDQQKLLYGYEVESVHGGGRNVLYLDGKVEFVEERVFVSLWNKTDAYLGKKGRPRPRVRPEPQRRLERGGETGRPAAGATDPSGRTRPR